MEEFRQKLKEIFAECACGERIYIKDNNLVITCSKCGKVGTPQIIYNEHLTLDITQLKENIKGFCRIIIKILTIFLYIVCIIAFIILSGGIFMLINRSVLSLTTNESISFWIGMLELSTLLIYTMIEDIWKHFIRNYTLLIIGHIGILYIVMFGGYLLSYIITVASFENYKLELLFHGYILGNIIALSSCFYAVVKTSNCYRQIFIRKTFKGKILT